MDRRDQGTNVTITVEEVMRQEIAKKRRLNYQDTSGEKLFGGKTKKESVQLV